MKISYKHIGLIYSTPKYVSVVLHCECGCGLTIDTNSLKCLNYGNIYVQCKSCGTPETLIRLDRDTVKLFHSIHFSHLSGVEDFLDKWEADMIRFPKEYGPKVYF